MKKTALLSVVRCLALVILAALLIVSLLHPRVHAQSACSNASLSGNYGYSLSGFYYVGQNALPYASSGVFVADGNGNLSGTSTASAGGVVTRNAVYNGTYQMTASCRGSITLHSAGTADFDVVLLGGGSLVDFVSSDTGTVVSGSAQSLSVARPEGR